MAIVLYGSLLHNDFLGLLFLFSSDTGFRYKEKHQNARLGIKEGMEAMTG
jgi:hypothetical protein